MSIFNIPKFFRKEKFYDYEVRKNILPTFYAGRYFYEYKGVTFNDDGSITVSGNVTDGSLSECIMLASSANGVTPDFELGEVYKFVYNGYEGDTRSYVEINSVRLGVGRAFIANNINSFSAYLYFDPDVTYNNFTFYPMICKATYDNDWYSSVFSNGVLTEVIKNSFYKHSEKWKPLNTLICAGYMTGSLRTINFTVPLDKSLANISSITCTKLTCVIRQSLGSNAGGQNGYVRTPANDNNWLTNSDVSVSVTKASNNAITVSLSIPSGSFAGSPASQNCLVAVQLDNSNCEFQFG